MIPIARIVVDPSVWDFLEIALTILLILAVLAFAYLIYIHITCRMAKKRHRDPLGWVLLSIFVSPVLTWIILLIAGDATN